MMEASDGERDGSKIENCWGAWYLQNGFGKHSWNAIPWGKKLPYYVFVLTGQRIR